MIRVRTQKYSLKGCVLAMQAAHRTRIHNLVIAALQTGLRAIFSYHLCCVRDLQFNIVSEIHISLKLFMAILLALSAFIRNLLKVSRRRNFFSYLRFDVYTGV